MRWMCLAAVGICLTAGVGATGSGIGVADAGDNFCGEHLARDYSAPLSRMRPVRAIPSRLSFAEMSVVAETPTTQVLVPGENMDISYQLRAKAWKPLAERQAWTMSSELVRVNGSGRPLGVVARKRLSVLALRLNPRRGAGFSFTVGRHPRFYAVRTEFRRPGGKLLQRYEEYFRVVAPTRNTALVISPHSIPPGGEVAFRVKNTGTLRTVFGEAFHLEKAVDGRWFRVRLGSKWHAVRLGLGSGELGSCQRLVVPDGLGSGRYRVQKELIDPSRSVSAEFAVTTE